MTLTIGIVVSGVCFVLSLATWIAAELSRKKRERERQRQKWLGLKSIRLAEQEGRVRKGL